MKQRDWQALLLRIAVVLGGLLVVLVSLILLYILLQVMLRFGDVLALFVMGAIIAYVLYPAVAWVTARVGRRWLGALVVYLGAAAALALLGVSLVQPFVAESSSLIRALHDPTAESIQVVTRISERSHAIGVELRRQRGMAEAGRIPQQRVHQIRVAITAIQNDVRSLGVAPVHAPPRSAGSNGDSTPQPQIRVPPSYLAPLQSATAALAADYRRATDNPAAPSLPGLVRSVSDAGRIASEARALHATLSTTPILLLDAQTWVDQHHIRVNVAKSAGQAERQIASQISSLLNNTAAILSQTATLLLDFSLILIISVYFVMDGDRMVRGTVAFVPDAYHRQAEFFVASLDSVLGGYIRAQILLALLAGTLGGVGAAVMGVPYALIIGVSTFLLQLLPVIGPMLVYVIPMGIALLFTSMPTPLILLAYFVILEQLVTNVIGPRVNSRSVGIHPLEAMAAALLAYPVAGVLGSFLAVPMAGLIHVVVGEAYSSWQAGNRTSSGAVTDADSAPDETLVPAPRVATHS